MNNFRRRVSRKPVKLVEKRIEITDRSVTAFTFTGSTSGYMVSSDNNELKGTVRYSLTVTFAAVSYFSDGSRVVDEEGLTKVFTDNGKENNFLLARALASANQVNTSSRYIGSISYGDYGSKDIWFGSSVGIIDEDDPNGDVVSTNYTQFPIKVTLTKVSSAGDPDVWVNYKITATNI